MGKQNSDWIIGGPWYKISICKKLHGKLLKNLLKMQELTDIISYVLLMHMKKIVHRNMMVESAVVVIQYH